MNEQARKEVLWWADSPTISTGFGTVSRNLLKVLNATGKYRFSVLGIGHLGLPFSVEQHPYLNFPDHGGMFSAQEGNDVYGMTKVMRMLGTGTFDILFILNDPFIMKGCLPQIIQLRTALKKKFKIVFYFPVDNNPKKEWADVIDLTDFPVAYTHFGRKSMEVHQGKLKEKLQVIYHGTDRETFRPIVGQARDVLRKSMFGPVISEKFLIVNVNRNQPRKDLNSTLQAFAALKKKRPNVFLYILAAMNDVGGNLEEIASHHGLVIGQDWECPSPKMYNPNQGIPVENVAQVYAAADLLITTTLGEGWGLSITEAMACGTAVIAPRHTSLVEIIGDHEERGWLVGAGGPGHTFCQGPMDNNTVRPVVHHDELVDRMKKVMDYPGQSRKKVESAFAWVPTWEQVGREWIEVFEKASLVDAPEESSKAP